MLYNDRMTGCDKWNFKSSAYNGTNGIISYNFIYVINLLYLDATYYQTDVHQRLRYFNRT